MFEDSIKITRYQGTVKNGMRDGVGINYYADGSYYEGLWKNDVPNGFGVFYNGEGVLSIGQYVVRK